MCNHLSRMKGEMKPQCAHTPVRKGAANPGPKARFQARTLSGTCETPGVPGGPGMPQTQQVSLCKAELTDNSGAVPS